MPDGTVAMRECKAGFHQFAVDLIKEAELHRIGGDAPDCEVTSAFGKSGSQCAGIGGMHGA